MMTKELGCTVAIGACVYAISTGSLRVSSLLSSEIHISIIMKFSIDSVILFALVSIKSCQALPVEPDQAGLDRRDYDTIQVRHFWRK